MKIRRMFSRPSWDFEGFLHKNPAMNRWAIDSASLTGRKLHMTRIPKNRPSVHPGLVLQDELEEIGLSQSALALHIGVLPKTINEICRGKRGISVETAWKLSKALGASPAFWLNLQNNWELSMFYANKVSTIRRVPDTVAHV